jgi:CheY-like chemotaxis protein
MHVRIMIVDDDSDTCSLLALILRIRYPRAKVACAFNGADALAAIEACGDDERPDAVITDIHMPIMGGVELCQALHHLPGPRIAIAGMSASHCDREGFDAAFSKPFDLPKLFEFVDATMRPKDT